MRDINLLAARARQRAFHDMYPMRESIAEPGRVYRTINYGPHLDVFMLDERSYRGPQWSESANSLRPRCLFHSVTINWPGSSAASRIRAATWKVIASDMPLSLIVYDDYLSKKAPKRLRKATVRRAAASSRSRICLRFIRRSRIPNTVWLTGGRALRAAHFYNPDKAQFQEFTPFWEFVAGPLHAGTGWQNDLDNTFGPEVKFAKAAPSGVILSPADGLQFFGRRQNRRRNRADDGDLARPRRRRAMVDDARSEADPEVPQGDLTEPVSAHRGGRGAPQHGLQRKDVQGFGNLGFCANAAGSAGISAVSADKSKGNAERLQPFGDRKALLAAPVRYPATRNPARARRSAEARG